MGRPDATGGPGRTSTGTATTTSFGRAARRRARHQPGGLVRGRCRCRRSGPRPSPAARGRRAGRRPSRSPRGGRATRHRCAARAARHAAVAGSSSRRTTRSSSSCVPASSAAVASSRRRIREAAIPITSLRRLRARRSASVPCASMKPRCSSIFSASSATPSPRAASVAQDRHLPAPRVLGERQDAAHLAHHRVGHRVVGLVDDDDVGDLHHAGLQRLDRVARSRHQREDDRVGMVDDVDLRLADADGLDQDVVLARRVHHQRHLQRRLREAAEGAARGHRADEDAGVEEVLGEPDPVAEQGATGERAGGIDREHRDLPVGLAHLRRSGRRSACDFPTPGGPVKPMIRALPVRG